MLRRHLSTRHGLTGEQYLKRWNLPTRPPADRAELFRAALEPGQGTGARPRRPAEPPRRRAAPERAARRARPPAPPGPGAAREASVAAAEPGQPSRMPVSVTISIHRHVEICGWIVSSAWTSKPTPIASGRGDRPPACGRNSRRHSRADSRRGRTRPAAPARSPGATMSRFSGTGMFQTPSTSVSPGRQARYSSGPFLSTRPAARPCARRRPPSRSAAAGRTRRETASTRRECRAARRCSARNSVSIARRGGAAHRPARLPQRDQPLALGPPPALYLIEVHAARSLRDQVEHVLAIMQTLGELAYETARSHSTISSGVLIGRAS